MGTTPNAAIPYIEPSDALANYPTQDKAQADRLDALLYQPSASMLRTTAMAVPSGVETLMLWDTHLRPLVGITYSAGYFTVPSAGRYLVLGTLTWEGLVGSYRQIRLRKATTLIDLREIHVPVTNANVSSELNRTLHLEAGEQISVAAYSTQATNLLINSIRTYNAIEIYKLGF